MVRRLIMAKRVPVFIGEIYSNWEIVEIHETTPIMITCRCVCGFVKTLLKTNVIRGKSKGCKACSIKRATKHKARGTRLHNIWQGVIQRCLSDIPVKTQNYKQRGITLFEPWKDFITFREWAYANNYADTLSLDRVDTYKGYYPENCRWVTPNVQSSNRRKMRNNTSGFVGVSEIKTAPHLKYKAYICVKGVQINLGRYQTPEEASAFRDKYIRDNGLTNYPTEEQRNEL